LASIASLGSTAGNQFDVGNADILRHLNRDGHASDEQTLRGPIGSGPPSTQCTGERNGAFDRHRKRPILKQRKLVIIEHKLIVFNVREDPVKQFRTEKFLMPYFFAVSCPSVRAKSTGAPATAYTWPSGAILASWLRGMVWAATISPWQALASAALADISSS